MYVPEDPVQERIEVSSLAVRLVSEKEQLSVSGDEVAVRVTVGEKYASRVMVTVEVPDELSSILTVSGLACKVKPGRLD